MDDLVVVKKDDFVNYVKTLNLAVQDLKNEKLILENKNIKDKVRLDSRLD